MDNSFESLEKDIFFQQHCP